MEYNYGSPQQIRKWRHNRHIKSEITCIIRTVKKESKVQFITSELKQFLKFKRKENQISSINKIYNPFFVCK